MNTVPVPKVDVVKRKSALWVTWKNLPLTLGFAANDPVWDLNCCECKANDYVVADAIKLEPVSTQTVSGLYFIHNDHLGTPKLITNISGTIVWQQHTTPFGEVTDTLATGINNLKSFPGQYRDSETGYSYNYYRDYDPSIGRYVQSDPIGLNGGLNTYGYAYQNPISNFDPDGRLVWFGVPVAYWAAGAVATAGAYMYGQWLANNLGNEPSYSVPSEQPKYEVDESDTERQAIYLRMKHHCDKPPLEGENRCSYLSKQIDHYENCADWYEYFDEKYNIVGKHAGKISGWRNRVENLKLEHQLICKKDCP